MDHFHSQHMSIRMDELHSGIHGNGGIDGVLAVAANIPPENAKGFSHAYFH